MGSVTLYNFCLMFLSNKADYYVISVLSGYGNANLLLTKRSLMNIFFVILAFWVVSTLFHILIARENYKSDTRAIIRDDAIFKGIGV